MGLFEKGGATVASGGVTFDTTAEAWTRAKGTIPLIGVMVHQ